MEIKSRQTLIDFPIYLEQFVGIPFKLAEIKVSYSTTIKKEDRITVRSSSDSYEIFWRTWSKTTIEYYEEFKVLYLNRANQVLGIHRISQGGVAGTVVDAKIVLGTALKVCASSIIMAHNHPSSNLKPSEADKQLTNKIKDGGKVVDITVLDHLIITPFGYFSFADEGLL